MNTPDPSKIHCEHEEAVVADKAKLLEAMYGEKSGTLRAHFAICERCRWVRAKIDELDAQENEPLPNE